MVINVSTVKSWDACERAAFYTHHARLSRGPSRALAIGTAFHNAIATGLANGWPAACRHVLAHAAAEIDPTLDIGEEYKSAAYVEETLAMVRAYQEAYEPIADLWTVVHPEVSFLVPVPNSEHNCIWHHWRDRRTGNDIWTPPSEWDILGGHVEPAHPEPDPSCTCWQPHRLAGKTDALVLNDNNLWLFEHKTTSYLSHVWWQQWVLDKQPTAYIWGVWRALGIRPVGVMLNAVRKPTEDQVGAWNSKRRSGDPRTVKDYITFERRPFLRSEEDLLRFERQLRRTLDTWEAAISDPDGIEAFPMRNVGGNCTQYNRVCPNHALCCQHGDMHRDTLLSFPRRQELTYVEEHQLDVINKALAH